MTTLLLGMGNPILCDDAIGVRLARDIGSQLEGMPGLVIEPECSVGGLNMIDVFQGHARAIVLDSAKTRDGSPGEWHELDAADLRETVHLTNIHDANFATALELGRRLGVPLPNARDIHIFVVDVEDNESFSETMTPALEATYPAISAGILSEVRKVLARTPPMEVPA